MPFPPTIAIANLRPRLLLHPYTAMGPATKSISLARNLAVCYKQDHRWYYVESLHAPRPNQVAVREVGIPCALDHRGKPLYLDVADLFVVLRDRPYPVHIPLNDDSAPPPPSKRQRHHPPQPPKAKPKAAASAHALYNYRKDVANGLLWQRFARDVAAFQVHALLLDAPPRGHPDPQPNSSAFLIQKKAVPPANIVVANPDAGIAARLADMGCVAHTMLFNDFVLRSRPERPFNYIYLDACGAYETQLRGGLQRMLENHERWIADEAVLSLVVCKRGAQGVLDTIRHDVDAWAHHYHYGRVLLYPREPDNMRMHSITFLLTRMR